MKDLRAVMARRLLDFAATGAFAISAATRAELEAFAAPPRDPRTTPAQAEDAP